MYIFIYITFCLNMYIYNDYCAYLSRVTIYLYIYPTWQLFSFLSSVLGWSSYQKEGIAIRCAIHWQSQTPVDLSYSMTILVLGWLFPLSLILYSYRCIFSTVSFLLLFIIFTCDDVIRLYHYCLTSYVFITINLDDVICLYHFLMTLSVWNTFWWRFINLCQLWFGKKLVSSVTFRCNLLQSV